jgi:microcystin-dependent protein
MHRYGYDSKINGLFEILYNILLLYNEFYIKRYFNYPPGSILAYAGLNTSAPSGWLFCNGSAVSRTTYASLFAVISTYYGPGDGSSTFHLPNLNSKFLYGESISSSGSLNITNGESTVTPTLTTTTGNYYHQVYADGSRSAALTGVSISEISILPPYMSMNYIIKT